MRCGCKEFKVPPEVVEHAVVKDAFPGYIDRDFAVLCAEGTVWDARHASSCPKCGAQDRVSIVTITSPEVIGKRLARYVAETLRALWKEFRA